MTEKEQKDREKLIAAITELLSDAPYGKLEFVFCFLIAGGDDQNDNRN